MNDKREALKQLVQEVAAQAIAAGADAAEVIAQNRVELKVKVRNGKPELIHEAGNKRLGLRLFTSRRAGLTYTSDFSAAALRDFIADSVAMCRLSEPDELNTLPDRDELARDPLPELYLWDDDALLVTAADALDRACRAEAAALTYSDKITNSEGATYSRSAGAYAYACVDRNGLGFAGASRGTNQSLNVEAICDDEGGKKRNGHYWTADRFVSRMLPAEEVGREAARRAVRKLGPVKIATAEMPVIFDPEAARGLIGALFSVISGGAIYRKQSYLCERENTLIASPLINIVDDPLIEGGPGSHAFDGDGLPSRRNVVVEHGVLRTFLCDTYAARKLGRRSTASASRAVGGAPKVMSSNFILLPGSQSPEALRRDVVRGLYVTDMKGLGFNPVTGDFSRGASGFLIENGELTLPVSEITVSANFDELLQRIGGVGSDIDRRAANMCPSLHVSRMTVAGR
ncbi:TldD/PmbA family protein [Sorangium sp. So ce321]|uniref:TldD/PmbA family protein n=1 Tax=Sorangium sp. So ce321 TaxID=3133300 RepID=UPI003F6383E2